MSLYSWDREYDGGDRLVPWYHWRCGSSLDDDDDDDDCSVHYLYQWKWDYRSDCSRWLLLRGSSCYDDLRFRTNLLSNLILYIYAFATLIALPGTSRWDIYKYIYLSICNIGDRPFT